MIIVKPIFWPSHVRIRLLAYFDDFHLAIGGWTSSGVDEGGDCHPEAITTANRLITSLVDKEEPAISEHMLFTIVEFDVVSR